MELYIWEDDFFYHHLIQHKLYILQEVLEESHLCQVRKIIFH